MAEPIYIMCVSPKGGVGKSMMIKLLATYLAKHDKKVLIADQDVGQYATAKYFLAKKIEGIDVLHQDSALDGYDYILIDTHGGSETQSLFFEATDKFVLMGDLSRESKRLSSELVAELKEKGLSNRIVHFFTKIDTRSNEKYDVKAYQDMIRKQELWEGVDIPDVFLPNSTSYLKFADPANAGWKELSPTAISAASDIADYILEWEYTA